MSVLDKVRKFRESRPKNENRGERMRGIFHDWKDGSNPIRLVGDFLEVRTHFLAPVPARGDRGLCMAEAFRRKGVQAKQGEEFIPQVINCPDWDIDKECEKKEKTCIICRLNAIARQALKENPEPEEKKYFEELMRAARARTSLKWNIFDRLDPDIIVVDDKGNEVKRKGLKIATIGMEAWDDIEGIFEQCGYDITDPEDGLDIDVKKGQGTQRTEYSAQCVLFGKPPTAKVTPFDEEEKAIVAHIHDLKQICGKQTAMEKVKEALHGDYRDLLDMNADATVEAAPAEEGKAAEGEKAPAETDAPPAVDEGEEPPPPPDDDEDALPSGKAQKKTARR